MPSLQAIEKLIGNTPIFDFSFLSPSSSVQLWAKLEWLQIGGSVKVRPAFFILKEAILSNKIQKDTILLDASSGNTGIAYATLGRALNIPVTLCVPENISIERKFILQTLGAELRYTSKFEGTDGAQEVAQQIYEKEPQKYYLANQYANEANWRAHYVTTGPEIWQQTSQSVTHFVCGLGTTGSFTGIARYLKQQNSSIQTIALQPSHAMHGLEGWKHLETAIVPSIFDPTLVDEYISIDTQEAYAAIKTFARKSGLFLSPSSAANLVGLLKVARQVSKGVLVTLLPDSGERYFEVLKDTLPSL
ncbi:MAG: cysteine synthase family protein [Bacteroidia bacterium]|nr:cysteine synthase family protein [Bacteroidia bacterium]MDW8158126.1 cysteine synthase family protein [Bacteroidia bacterium]